MQNKKIYKLFLQGLVLVAIIGFAVYFARLAEENETIRNLVAQYGYSGIFIIALISGFNLAVPIPAVSFMPLFLESGLSFWPTIFIIAVGVTIADMAAYFLGWLGRGVTAYQNSSLLERLKTIHDKYRLAPLAVVFVFACIAPIPNEVILIPLAFFGYRAIHILPVVFAGNLIFNALYSKGFTNLFNLFS